MTMTVATAVLSSMLAQENLTCFPWWLGSCGVPHSIIRRVRMPYIDFVGAIREEACDCIQIYPTSLIL